MNAATRMKLGLSLLIGVFVACTGLAVAVLAMLEDPWIGVVAAVAALACVLAAAITYLIGRSLEEQALEAEPQHPATSGLPQPALKVQSLPVAELPPEYLEAVMKGVRANRAAFRSQTLH
jgi:membrane protein YqaA with SNARE-associated domain